MTEAKITNSMREVLVAISQDKEPSAGFETMMRCVEAGLLNYDDRRYSLTPEGSKVASEFKKASELQRAKRNRSSRVKHSTLTSLGMKRTRSGAYEGAGMKSIKEGLSDGPDDSAQIIAAINKHLSIGDRQVYYKPMLPGLWINYYNLPKGSGKAGGGAESENNRVALLIRPKGDKYSVEYKISAIGREWGLRAKTAPLDKLGKYIADHLNKIAKEVPPKWTHTRQEDVRSIEDRMYKLLGEEDDSDEMLDELLSEMDEEDIDFLHSLDEDELTDFFEECLAEDGGEWTAASTAAKLSADAFFSSVKAGSKHRLGDGWESTVQIEVPDPGSKTRDEVRWYFSFRGQYFPNGGYNFSVQISGPLSYHNASRPVIQQFEMICQKLQAWGSLLKPFGKVKWYPDKGAKGIAKLWVDLDEKKAPEALEKIPALAKKLASSLSFKAVSQEDVEISEDQGSCAGPAVS